MTIFEDNSACQWKEIPNQVSVVYSAHAGHVVRSQSMRRPSVALCTTGYHSYSIQAAFCRAVAVLAAWIKVREVAFVANEAQTSKLLPCYGSGLQLAPRSALEGCQIGVGGWGGGGGGGALGRPVWRRAAVVLHMRERHQQRNSQWVGTSFLPAAPPPRQSHLANTYWVLTLYICTTKETSTPVF